MCPHRFCGGDRSTLHPLLLSTRLKIQSMKVKRCVLQNMFRTSFAHSMLYSTFNGIFPCHRIYPHLTPYQMFLTSAIYRKWTIIHGLFGFKVKQSRRTLLPISVDISTYARPFARTAASRFVFHQFLDRFYFSLIVF